ncbi:MAG: uroporphyrinogen-III synthase [Novosphingobium sp.]|nr:uroporphyrinogen-III synthase [Novosphingobium sp.]
MSAVPLIAIRPEPGCSATVATAEALGLTARGFPLFEIEPRAWHAPERIEFDALLIGSANALRHAGPELERYSGLPTYVVGEVTAGACRAAGFEVVAVGSGGLQEVLGRVETRHRRLLRLAGEERIALDPPPGITLIERVVYVSRPLPMPTGLTELLSAPAVVLLHSAAAARHFAAECARQGVARANVALAAIGPRVAAAAGGGWREVATASQTGDSALLALAREMCQTLGRRDRQP